MAYTFQEIMDYKPKHNQDVYDEIKKHLSDLIPFVGAGLTNFAYGSWPGALKTLAGYISDTKTKQEIRQLIRDKKPLEAAQKLEDARGPNNLAHDLVNLFSAEKLEKKRNQLPREAISLLPYLFPNLVLTTNFDQALETVYQESGHPFAGVLHPGQPELLVQFLRANGNQGLLKLHGTIIGSNIDYSKIVFTLRQYDHHYSPGSELGAALADCYRQKMMLFLGCSLEKDRTMEVLRKVWKKGQTHYAILNCPRAQRDARLLELDAMGIRAIVYPKGRHEAVRVILEKLLEDTQPDVYQQLSVRVGELRSLSTSRFAYNANLISFTGRKKELGLLQKFLGEPNIAFRWWAIVGPGGSGKSRLAYELQQQLQGTNWDVRWLARGDYSKLSTLTPQLTQPTLLIADYVQQYAQELGQWMEELAEQHRSQPLRLLLVERDSSQTEEGFSWQRQLYLRVADTGKLEKSCFAQFLALQPLDDSSLGEIMTNYAAAPPAKQTLLEDAKAMLLKRLHSIDPDLQRPLYALFLTDAWLENPRNPERWNREDVLKYVTLREQNRLKQSIHDTFKMPIPVLHRACLRLYAMATVWQDAPYAQLQEQCLKDWQTVTNYATNYGEPEDLLQAIGLGNQDGVDALRPDLVGEYFVLSWLQKNASQAEAFLQTAWQNPLPTAVFLDRTIRDYAHLLNESPDSWQLLFPVIRSESLDAAFLAAQLLANAIGLCTFPAECTRLAGQLEAIAAAHPNVPEITIAFANGLANLSAKQDSTEATKTVKRLEHLTKQHSDIPEIAIAFANGLFNLSINQGTTEAADTVNRLEQLRSDHPGVPEIAIAFAQRLVNLSAKQDASGVADTVKRLEQLTKEYPDIPEIAIQFANGLFNLSNNQKAAEAADTVSRLDQLRNDHPSVPEIAIRFAQGLANLSHKQDAAEAAKTVHRLEQLRNDHPDISEIAFAFARGLVNVSYDQNSTEAAKTVHRLEQLRNDHPGVPEIAIEFAKGLFNLSYDQGATGAADTVNRLEQLRNDHPGIPEIAIEFANGLVNLSAKQDATEATKTVQRLEQLMNDHPDMPEIAIEFAKGLVNLANHQDATEAAKTVSRLEHLMEQHSDIPEIAIRFAKGLVNLTRHQDATGAARTVHRLEQLRNDHPDIPENAIAFAMGLLGLFLKQDATEAAKTIHHLEQLADGTIPVPNIAKEFAQCCLAVLTASDKETKKTNRARIQQIRADLNLKSP